MIQTIRNRRWRIDALFLVLLTTLIILIAMTGCAIFKAGSTTQPAPTTRQVESELNLRVKEAVILDIALSKDPKSRASAIYDGASRVKTAMDAGADVRNLPALAGDLILSRLPAADRAKAGAIISIVTLELTDDLGIDVNQPVPDAQVETVRQLITASASAAMEAAATYR
jgi:hypothetical protein